MSDLGNKDIMAKNIKHYMDKNGIGRNKLSDDLDIKYTTLTDWINGKTYPRIDKIEILANYFGISKSDLVEDRNNDILSIYNKLNELRQGKVYKYAEYQLSEQKNNVINLPATEEDKEIKILSGHKSAAGFAILGDDSNMTSTVMKASKVPSGADEIVEITGDSMEPLIMKGEQVFIRHQPSVENGEIAIVAILDDGITCKKVYYDDIKGNVTLESVNDDYEDMVFPAEEIRIIGKVLGK
ncbi:XRE family transcriptional regulator [Carnobacterium maltaromaticum]|uniref:XRE family transcriptional regulator n=1 Tax=Carnobacterium maltaromaticum TaxID=2751 RepID=UPI00026C8A7F|nr:XRE family transcriptional regulator [Carnobacterium maltaromaticum]